jgi:hypothetical protein
MKSTEFLQAAIDTQAERGKQYDSPEGERSMGRTVQAFNAITGRDLTEAEGWLLLQTLKDVRQWQNPDKYHHDSALDGVAYASLKAEALSAGEATAPPQWVKHEGGPMPVAVGTPLLVRYRSGAEAEAMAGSPYAQDWGHSGHPMDIVAYRLA